MSANPSHRSSGERSEDPTTGIRTEFSEPTAPATTGLGDIDALPPGSAVLVVKRARTIRPLAPTTAALSH